MIKLGTGVMAIIGVVCLTSCTKGGSAQPDASLVVDGWVRGDGVQPGDGVKPTDGPRPDGYHPATDGYHPPSDGPNPPTDGPTPPPTDGGQPPTSYKVAAVQYAEGQASLVKASCASDPMPDVCAVQEMIKQANAKGAYFAVTPEYGLGQQYYEPSPPLGDNPGTSSAWPADTIIKKFSQLAKQLNMYITIDLLTYTGQKPNQTYYNTAVSFDPTGKVVDVHYKFNLYSNEGTTLTEGTDVTVFNTPLGNMGVVICSDIQGTADEPLRQKLAYTLKARVVLLPAMWGPNPGIPFFKSFASKYGFYVAAANTTAPTGQGGGIFSPTGAILDQTTSTSPVFVIAAIPVPGTPPPPPPPSSSKVVITEIMVDPKAVSDTAGEWIELYNADTTPVDLKGWTLGDTSSSHTISQSVTLAPGQYKVLAVSTNTTQNGGVPAAYAYSSVTLNNSGDTISLYDTQNALVDEVKYLAGWTITAGASLSLKQPTLDNNVATNWCTETTVWTGSAGDKGSPGAAAVCK